MRTEKEIKKRIKELQNTQPIANKRLKLAIKEKNKKDEIYWDKTVKAFESQIYAMKFCLGITD